MTLKTNLSLDICLHNFYISYDLTEFSKPVDKISLYGSRILIRTVCKVFFIHTFLHGVFPNAVS